MLAKGDLSLLPALTWMAEQNAVCHSRLEFPALIIIHYPVDFVSDVHCTCVRRAAMGNGMDDECGFICDECGESALTPPSAVRQSPSSLLH